MFRISNFLYLRIGQNCEWSASRDISHKECVNVLLSIAKYWHQYSRSILNSERFTFWAIMRESNDDRHPSWKCDTTSFNHRITKLVYHPVPKVTTCLKSPLIFPFLYIRYVYCLTPVSAYYVSINSRSDKTVFSMTITSQKKYARAVAGDRPKHRSAVTSYKCTGIMIKTPWP